MIKTFLFIFLITFFDRSYAAIDIPLEVRASQLKFSDGSELSVQSNGVHLLLIDLKFRGKKYFLVENAFKGIESPDLASIKLKLISGSECSEGIACLDYSTPMIELDVDIIPEDNECMEGCIVRFILKDGQIIRKTLSKRRGGVKNYPQTVY